MWFQWFSFYGVLFFTLVFCIQFCVQLDKEDKLCIPDFDYNSTCDYTRSHP